MSNAFKPVWGLFLIIVLFVIVMAAARWSQAEEIVPWREDIAAASAEAETHGRPLMLYFTASWCPPCQRMRGTTWADASVEAALREYVPVRVDIDQHPGLANEFQIESVPSFVLIRPDGTVRATSGFQSAGEFLRWLGRP
jgi:thiol:disulfide interchange protein